jgi:hypothetical protein
MRCCSDAINRREIVSLEGEFRYAAGETRRTASASVLTTLHKEHVYVASLDADPLDLYPYGWIQETVLSREFVTQIPFVSAAIAVGRPPT